MRAWHFLAANNVMRDGREAPRDGVKLKHAGRVIPCESGLHASEHPFDALRYAPGPVLCLVECGGVIVPHGSPVDKIAASERTIIARMDAAPLLRLFARMQALSVAHLMGDGPPAVVLDYLMTGDESIRAAAAAYAADAADAAAAAAAYAAAAYTAADAYAARAAADAARAAAAYAAYTAAAADAARAAAREDFARLVHEAFVDHL